MKQKIAFQVHSKTERCKVVTSIHHQNQKKRRIFLTNKARAEFIIKTKQAFRYSWCRPLRWFHILEKMNCGFPHHPSQCHCLFVPRFTPHISVFPPKFLPNGRFSLHCHTTTATSFTMTVLFRLKLFYTTLSTRSTCRLFLEWKEAG